MLRHYVPSASITEDLLTALDCKETNPATHIAAMQNLGYVHAKYPDLICVIDVATPAQFKAKLALAQAELDAAYLDAISQVHNAPK